MVSLKVGRGSKITHSNQKIVGGKVLLAGGIQLSKGAEKLRVSNVAVGFKAGIITAKVGAKADVEIGSVINPTSIEVIKRQGSTHATLQLANDGIVLNADLIASIDAALGTTLGADFDAGAKVDAALNVGVDLVVGGKVNRELIIALGLGAYIEPDADVDALQNLDLDVSTDLP